MVSILWIILLLFSGYITVFIVGYSIAYNNFDRRLRAGLWRAYRDLEKEDDK